MKKQGIVKHQISDNASTACVHLMLSLAKHESRTRLLESCIPKRSGDSSVYLVYIYTYTQMCIYTYIYIYIFLHTHTSIQALYSANCCSLPSTRKYLRTFRRRFIPVVWLLVTVNSPSEKRWPQPCHSDVFFWCLREDFKKPEKVKIATFFGVKY